MVDPAARAAFQISASLLAFLVKEGILSKDQALNFLDGMIENMKQNGDTGSDIMKLVQFARNGIASMSEPTKN